MMVFEFQTIEQRSNLLYFSQSSVGVYMDREEKVRRSHEDKRKQKHKKG